jgi:hypothetical protein
MSEDRLRLPEVPFGAHSISRLIAGGNPPQGGSHQTRLMDRHMNEYFTPEGTVDFLRRCRRQGINTWQSSYTPRVWEALTKFRAEGEDIQFICLCSPDQVADPAVFQAVLDLRPIGIAFHGEVTDRIWRAGKIDTARDTLSRIRDAGVRVGLSTHNPEVIDHIESQDWDLDFFMACVYRKSRDAKELSEIMKEVPIGEVYLPSDFPRMCETIRRASRTCLAFKILAAGRTCDSPEQVRRAFEFAYGHIKPGDAVIVGMYPRYTDQVAENAELARAFG